MIVPSDSKLPQIVVHKKKKKKEGLSYYEQVEAQKLAYRNARMPRRIPTPRPPTPPEIEEEIVVKPKGRKQQTVQQTPPPAPSIPSCFILIVFPLFAFCTFFSAFIIRCYKPFHSSLMFNK
mmetsp:Transcript_41651/g.53723  ORF Transcript_41651/g.53723 Transcript_41651/m.53723 type:complete len:121 (-) Transcript_41651:1276-1638(-)